MRKLRFRYETTEDLHKRYNHLKGLEKLTGVEKEELQRLTYVVTHIFKEVKDIFSIDIKTWKGI